MMRPALQSFAMIGVGVRAVLPVFAPSALAIAVSCLSAGASPEQGPRFGDSTWVAPYADLATVSAFDSAGSRVAAPDRTPFSESALRFPFRVIAFPFRLVGLGAEYAAGAMGTRRTRQRGFPHPSRSSTPKQISWLPYVDWAERARFRVGLNLSYGQSADRPRPTAHAALAGGKADWQAERDRKLAESAAAARNDSAPGGLPVGGAVDVSWSYSDHRRAVAEIEILARESAIGLGGEAGYVYRPNLLFFGIGPETSSDRRSIYLAEEGRGDLFLRFGSRPLLRMRLGAGVSHIAVRGGAGVPSIEEEFTPADQVPFVGQSTTVVRYGGSAVLGRLDGRFERTQPVSSGFEARAEGWLYEDLDGSALEWTEWRGEARAYIPVFADRRVLALRGLYASVHPAADSPALPFYRLPGSAGDLLFRAFESGRFRDRRLVVGDVEYRWWLWEWLWAVGFAQLGWVAPSSDALRFDQVHESYGGGIRAAVTSNLLYRLDIAHGSEGTQTDFRFGVQF